MIGPAGERCDSCYFSDEWGCDEDPDPYHCHRFPPSDYVVDVDGTRIMMPVRVSAGSWCGEFKPKPVSEQSMNCKPDCKPDPADSD